MNKSIIQARLSEAKEQNDNNCINGNCSRCGNCCTPFLPMSKSEVKKVKDYLRLHPDIEKRGIENNPIKGKDVYIRCCFYDSDKKECMIYPVRPGICKLYKCDQSKEVMDANKLIQSTTAKYNTTDLKTINDFRNILWGDATLITAGLIYFLAIENMNELYNVVKSLERTDLIDYVEHLIKKNEEEK